MKWFIEFMFSGFFTFCGLIILLSGIANFIFILWNRFWRHWTIRKWGYPPPHCDADGDFPNIESEEVENV
jgi:hypothetical protein